jgi:hypothetical protein
MLTIQSAFGLLPPPVTARTWIDAFFFRASAMLPPDKGMVLNMEHAVPATIIAPKTFLPSQVL